MINHKFSIIVIAYNNKPELQSTLNSINTLIYPRDHFEVIVVDDGTSPRLETSLESSYNYNVRFHYIPRTKSSGRSKARNEGAKLASYDALVFVDGDQYVGSELLNIYSDYLTQSPDTSILLGTRIDLSPWQSQLLMTSNSLDTLKKIIRQKKDIRIRMNEFCETRLMSMHGAWTLFWSHNFFITKSVFDEIGGFDENFIHWGFEDVEFGYRLIKNHHYFEIVENNVFNLHQEARYTPKKYYGWLKNIEYFYQKYEDIGIMCQLGFYESFEIDNKSDEEEFISVFNGFSKFTGKLEFIDRMRSLATTS